MADQQRSRFNLSLQTKIVFLVLFPMLVLAVVLSVLETRSSAERIQETLDEQRDLLIGEREKTVRYLLE